MLKTPFRLAAAAAAAAVAIALSPAAVMAQQAPPPREGSAESLPPSVQDALESYRPTQDVLDELVTNLDDNTSETKTRAVNGFRNLGIRTRSAAPEIAKRLRRADGTPRWESVLALSYAEPSNPELAKVVPDALKLTDPPGFLAKLLRSLSANRVTPEHVLPLLAKLVPVDNDDMRPTVLASVANYGPLAADFAPVIIEMTRTGQLGARSSMGVLRSIAPQDPATVALGRDLLTGAVTPKKVDAAENAGIESLATEQAAAEMLAAAGTEAAIGTLRDVAASQLAPTTSRTAAIQALAGMGPRAASADPVLRDVFSMTLEGQPVAPRIVRIAAAGAIGALDQSPAPECLAFLAQEMEAADERTRNAAIESLGMYGSKAKPVIPRLATMMKSPDHALSTAAGRALARIGPEAVPTLREAVAKGGLSEKARAISALGLMGAAGAPAVPELIEATKDSQYAAVAMQSLAAVGAGSDDVFKFFMASLSSENFAIRLRAAQGLGQMGTRAQEALPALKALDSDSHPGVRSAGSEAIFRIQREVEREAMRRKAQESEIQPQLPPTMKGS